MLYMGSYLCFVLFCFVFHLHCFFFFLFLRQCVVRCINHWPLPYRLVRMDAPTLVYYAFLVVEAVLFVSLCFVFDQRRHQAVEDAEADDTTTSRAVPTSIDGYHHNAYIVAATVLYTTTTARRQRRPMNLSSYFPAAEVGPAVVEGKVVMSASNDEELEKDAPYGKADYIVRPLTPRNKSRSSN